MQIQRARLLIVEDDAEFRNLLMGLLRDEFFVSAAEDGCAGYSRAVSHRPDIVLLDLHMPGWDGLRSLAAFRNNAKLKDVPVIILTGDDSREAALAALQAGADGYLLKDGFSKEVLLPRIRSLLPQLGVPIDPPHQRPQRVPSHG